MNKKEQMESFMNAVIRRFVKDVSYKNCIKNDGFGARDSSSVYIANIHWVYREYINSQGLK